MSNHKNLFFFNKEGDYLNFQYNEVDDRFEGNILFHENSTDTFKTYGIYTLENIPSFEFELPGELTTDKFQLFNEKGFHFYGSNWSSQQVLSLEPVNNDPNFYTKWVYGSGFEAKFPIGTLVKFDNPYLEFTNLNQVYTVVGSKSGAIMILSQMDNATFETSFYNDYTFGSFVDLKITGVNAFGVYDYIEGYNNNLSNWNEPNFYLKYSVGQKLNIIGSEKNDSILTVNNVNLNDMVHYEYDVSRNSLPQDSDLIIEVLTRTDVPLIYSNVMTFGTNSRILISDYPSILKPGVEFKVVGSNLNTNFFTVASMIDFSSLTSTTYFDIDTQVLWNNKVYQCSQAYTQSFGIPSTSFITPENYNYWIAPNYIKIEQDTFFENLLSAQIYLTTDRYYFTYGYTQSTETTLASAAEKYKSDLESFNIDLFYLDKNLRADLMYPSQYAVVNFYHTQLGETYSIGSTRQTLEKLVGVEDTLNYELNYNYSNNFRYNIIFTDIDEFGLKVKINGMVYDEEAAIVYSGSVIDMERTIDRTLRNWLKRWYFRLVSLGISTELLYTGNFTSVFYNSILIKSEYPNVPIIIDSIEVGTTANYYIEDSKINFTNLGGYLNININDEDYGQVTIFGTGSIPDISATLAAWSDSHSEILVDYGVNANVYNTILKLDLNSPEFRLDYTINTGKVTIPGLSDYKITKKRIGSDGVLVASNKVSLPASSTSSFEEAGFATGMAFSINNTFYSLNNQDYVIQNLDPNFLNLSYQGPFWGLTSTPCNSSAFATLGFNNGFGQTACSVVVPLSGTGGPFDPNMFDPNMFSLTLNPNIYSIEDFGFGDYSESNNMVDIKYIQLSGSIYGFGDGVIVVDAFMGNFISAINLPGNTQSIEMEFNGVNSYLYCLSKKNLWVIDPTNNTVVTGITFSSSVYDAYDMCVNPLNGDVYVSFGNTSSVFVWSYNNLNNTPSDILSTGAVIRNGKMVFNDFEGDIYITTDTDVVRRFNGSDRSFQTDYGVPGLTFSIFYEPVNESVFVYGSQSLWVIDNGITQSISNIETTGFSDLIFNNLSGKINISDSSYKYWAFTLGDSVGYSNTLSNYGYLGINQYDGDVYISSQVNNVVLVVNSETGFVKSTQAMSAQTSKLIYNPERKTIWTLQPSTKSIIEIAVELNNQLNILPLTYSFIEDNTFGTLDPDYVPKESVWLKTRDYFRRPRENFEGSVSVKYYWKWLTDEVPEFFMYDFSGEQLDSSGVYKYTGPKPLTNAVLRNTPNKDATKVSYPEYQQTIFNKIEYTLSYIDDDDDFSVEAKSLELFLGYKASSEGPLRSVLQLYKREDVQFDIISDGFTNLTFTTLDLDNDNRRGQITINQLSTEIFTNKGLKVGHHLVIYVKDTSNIKSQYISENNAILVKIKEIYSKILVVDFFNKNIDLLEDENTALSNYPSYGKNTYLKVTLKVVDKEIGRFITFGQSEEEDIRFKTELGNIGKLINPEEVFIFKEYDINEGGIDWVYLNKKRKEMLMVRDVIYPYIGSYKSLINAINYFGYNDLELNEYYRNIDSGSREFGNLFKIEIPDIFDNTIKGWNENDFLKKYLPSDKYEETYMFNLTYFITDKEGNYILNYSIDEIIIKLQGLKYWLKRNIIPLTHKILDITGRVFFTGGSQIQHQLYDMKIIKISDEMSPITFKMNEAYLYPVNSGSTVYNCVLDFYNIKPGVGANISEFEDNPVPYIGSNIVLPELYDVKIRTYKIYKEWAPFKTYSMGDKISYYDKIYESQIDNNKAKSPRRFENTQTWTINTTYELSSVVEYNRDFYVYSGLGPYSTESPNLDELNWLKITEWRELDLEPVQILNETRSGEDLLPYNFTVDSNLDPFIVIDVTSHSGYGGIYRDKKNYYLKGTKDLTESYQYIDPIGPFVAIVPIY